VADECKPLARNILHIAPFAVDSRVVTLGLRWRRQTLALLSGALCDAALWRHQIAGLSDFADVRVADLTRDDNIAAMAARTLAGLPPQFALAGLSLGGYVALEIMRRAPGRVTKLALLDTTARPGDKGEEAFAEPVTGATERRAEQVGLFTTLLIHPKRLADRRLSAILGAMAERVGRKAFLRQQRAAVRRPDSRPGLAAIRCPTLLICGRQDPLAPPALLEEMASAIPGAQLLIIEDCGHLSPLEQPEVVTAALRRWLQSAQ
jgi:pimeloyl-ACP methyl ester carboxylesterase